VIDKGLDSPDTSSSKVCSIQVSEQEEISRKLNQEKLK